jgi:hypothetical protein
MALFKKATFCVIALSCLFLLINLQAQAGEPSGSNWFQLLTTITTGGDNTGDGGTGNPDNFNYYYVGQSWTQNIRINSDGTNASNIWIDHDATYVTSSNLNSGTYFPVWTPIYSTSTGGSNFRILQTGYRVDGLNSSGPGNFGSFQLTALQPTAANYGTGTFQTLDINIGSIGNTTESNISLDGFDLLDDAEDFNFHIWADTIKPYAVNPNPVNTATNVSVSQNYTFQLIDSKNGEGDDSGTGTGINTATGAITFNGTDYKSISNFPCSGHWGNLCNVTVDPPTSPSSISGDQRNWEYSTAYTVEVSGFKDNASDSQDQLMDANGPNTMGTTTWTFTTESDTIAPTITPVTPLPSASGVSIYADIVIDILDKKSANISGVGVDASTCEIDVTSPSLGTATYSQGSSTVNAVNYGYRFTINPDSDFAQNETITVTVSNCKDWANNATPTYIYTFSTADLNTPYITDLNPTDNAIISENQSISFNIKDDGSGVNINRTVVYVNGVYYTHTGWSGVITNNGTKITIPSSSPFGVSGTVNNYNITINPLTTFSTGESVPIIIYSQDTIGNLMERYIYSVSVSGATCAIGSSYCGANTSWNSSLFKCVGTGGGSGSSSGGGGNLVSLMQINPATASTAQVNETSVLITWYSSMAGDSRVVYGLNSPQTIGTAPNFGYEQSTSVKNSNSTYHSVLITGLTPGNLYYFKPITTIQGNTILGSEMAMAPLFKAEVTTCPVCPETPVCPTCPVCEISETVPPITTPVVTPPPVTTEPTTPSVIRPPQLEDTTAKPLRILNIIIDKISADQSVIKINGRSQPASKLILTIY